MGGSTDACISDFAKRYISKGRADGRAEAPLLVVEPRGFSDELWARITGCTDVEQLDTWLTRAVTVANVGAIFNN